MESACKHDTSARSTLTLTIALSLRASRLVWLTCSACKRRVAFEPQALDSSWQWPSQVKLASAWFASRPSTEAAPSNSSPTDSSSSLPEATSTEQASAMGATNGLADYLTTSPTLDSKSLFALSIVLREISANPANWTLHWHDNGHIHVQMDSLRELRNRMTLHGGLARLKRLSDGYMCEATLAALERAGRR